jgi:hypothetical protein
MLKIRKSALESLHSIEVREDGVIKLEWTVDANGNPLPSGETQIEEIMVVAAIIWEATKRDYIIGK